MMHGSGRGRRSTLRFASVLCAAIVLTGAQAARTAENPIRTNEAYVNEVLNRSAIDIRSIDQVFDYVFGSLGDEVTIYPTENYYYFKFAHDGALYAGNFRLDIADRDEGIIHFAYFSENNPVSEQEISEHRAYSEALGVKVEKLGDLAYAVTSKGRTVTFKLNDLRHVRPAESQIGQGETYLGPVFDESGVQFFLTWNPELKQFAYVLDESVASEDYHSSTVSSQVKIGLRTGFAYYRDRYRDRWILVGVRAYETQLNTFFDGPFDQLPDNFLEGDVLRNALLALSPEVEGKIDRLGNSRDLTGRMLVDPYILYSEEAELSQFDDCAASAIDPETYYPCLAVGQSK